jgi:glycosidase
MTMNSYQETLNFSIMKTFQKMDIVKNLSELLLLLPLLIILFLVCCKGGEKKLPVATGPESRVIHPEWSRNANIYEVNIRQFTPEGTFQALGKALPRLKDLGADIIWLMPINPIGVKNRKGPLGSYYSIKDYMAVNPEYGTMDDLKDLVKSAHEKGMHVIIDWVANHTAWDNRLMTDHPDWYTRDSTGKVVSPFDWSDVADLNYDKKELWDYMIGAMKFWLQQADIDGFRCDVAGMVPVEFWNQARTELDKVKPVFMLAEAEEPSHHLAAFDMSYSWELYHIFNQIAKGEKNALDIETYFIKQDTLYPKDAYRMLFTSNHDENSWNGTEYERLGPGVLTFAMLTVTLPGMPLIYNGQEAAFTRRLKFFEKDSITWDGYKLKDFYKNLLALKHTNQALWNGSYGGRLERIGTNADTNILAFIREKEGERIFVIANLSDKMPEFKLRIDGYEGLYREIFTKEEMRFDKQSKMKLRPWEYKVYILKKAD